MTHLLQSGREPFPIANERHLMDQTDIIFHVIHHIGEGVFFHWAKVKEKSIRNVGGSVRQIEKSTAKKTIDGQSFKIQATYCECPNQRLKSIRIWLLHSPVADC
jgi:hypothetical protein